MNAETVIAANALHDALPHEQIVVLDCRYSLQDFNLGAQLYMKDHIPGSYFMDIGYDLSSPVIAGVTGRHPLPDPEVLATHLSQCGIERTTQVIAYDQGNGAYAARAWWLLNWLGHKRVAIINGGFAQWVNAGYETDNQWTPPAQGHFKAQINDQLLISAKEIAGAKELLIDSREYKRYTGETEPIDPVAGHIPGAVCLPYQNNLNPDLTWKSEHELSEIFVPLQKHSSTVPVFYCGSGVTACHNLLAYRMATGKDGLLYAGSFSEWIIDHPVKTGPTP